MSKRKLNENDVPEPSAPMQNPAKATFSSLALDPRLLQALSKEKFSAPTPVQAKAVPLVLSGKDVLARAKTGSGKTLAYLLPIIHCIIGRKASSANKKTTIALILVPTKELAVQVCTAITDITVFCGGDVRCENVTRKEDAAVTRARLSDSVPDIVVATPTRANQWINQEVLKTEHLKFLVIDEADLVLSFGHEEDLRSLAQTLPVKSLQKIMMSATLRTEVDTLTQLFFGEDSAPELLDMSAEEKDEKKTLAQYTVRTAEDEKFLLIYAIFKLQLIKGKVIIFVADTDRCYRIKLFLEQFGIRSCVLNSELPVNSRLHAVDEFNKGVYDIIIAADESEVVGDEQEKSKRRKTEPVAEADEDGEDAEEVAASLADSAEQEAGSATAAPPPDKKKKPHNRKSRPADREYGVSRGIDFRHVTCVLNFDLPSDAKSYTHRIGRTARAGQTGMALSFHVPKELYRKHKPTSIPACANDDAVLEEIIALQVKKGDEVKAWGLDWAKLEGFRYRLADALRSVTRIAVRETRTKELRAELLKSEKLKRHFEENPEDLKHLRHDTESHAIRQQPHLKHVPDYLLPAGGKQAVSKDVGFVGIGRTRENGLRHRKARGGMKGRKGKGLDPLKSFNAKGRGKK